MDYNVLQSSPNLIDDLCLIFILIQFCYRILFSFVTGSYSVLLQDPFQFCYRILYSFVTGSYSVLLQDPIQFCYRILFSFVTGSYSILLQDPNQFCYRILFSFWPTTSSSTRMTDQKQKLYHRRRIIQAINWTLQYHLRLRD